MNKNFKKILILFLIINSFYISFASSGGGGCSINKHYDQFYETDTHNIIDKGNLPSSIYDPFGNEIFSNKGNYFEKKILTMTNVPNFYTNPGKILTNYNSNIIKQFNYETGDLQAQNLKYNCQIGGQYTINGYYKTGEHIVIGCDAYYTVSPIPKNLFYCKTTKDLFDQVKIPQSWSNNKIIIYCNNGLNTNFKEFNVDFLTTKLDTYNSCIIKNLDLPQNNTIIYSFEKGNQIMDYKVHATPLINQIFANFKTTIQAGDSNFNVGETKSFTIPKTKQNGNLGFGSGLSYNSTVDNLSTFISEKYPLIKDFDYTYSWISGHTDSTSSTETYQITLNSAFEKDNIITDVDTNKKYKFSRIKGNSLFTLYDVNDFSNPIPISDIIDSSKFNLTRPILAKSFDSSKKLIGYEDTLKKEFPNSKNTERYNFAMYKIKFLGFGNIQNMCMNSLGKYGAKETLAESQSIICSSNKIKINDYIMTTRLHSYGLNVFKNIILDTND